MFSLHFIEQRNDDLRFVFRGYLQDAQPALVPQRSGYFSISETRLTISPFPLGRLEVILYAPTACSSENLFPCGLVARSPHVWGPQRVSCGVDRRSMMNPLSVLNSNFVYQPNAKIKGALRRFHDKC
jgi:hypothetical protein